MQPKSHTLFHFTKNIEVIKKILKEGFWPKYCLEDTSWYIHDIDYLAFPIVSFCDIPLSRINEHVDFYGEYGIGLNKSWALKNRLNPVSYLTDSSNYGLAINNLFKGYHEKNTFYENSGIDLNMILSNIKPLEGKMFVSGELFKKEFYQENEWRFSPNNSDISMWIPKEEFDNQITLDEYNRKTKELCSLRISPSDIKYIFVKRDSDIPEIINFIQTEMDMYSSADLKILMSRVISLESISSDL